MKRTVFFVFIASIAIAAQGICEEVALTIYNQNLGLVKQTQSLDFKKGIAPVKFDDVASSIDPTSVHINVKKSGISILEQNYQYDLVGTQKMMQRYLGTSISVITKSGDIRKGNLLSFDGKYIILENESGEITITNADLVVDYRFGSLPEGLILKPTLVWMAESESNQKSDCEVSYLTDGLNWHAEYVAVVDKEDKNLNLSGWVSIENLSGATYKDASLKLVAGTVNRIQPDQPHIRLERDLLMSAKAAPQFQEESFFEYHLYTLNRRATVANNETKQLSLFPETGTPATKVYTVENQSYYWDDSQNKPKVRVNMEFTNSEKLGLGMPLPKGKIRVYKADSQGDLQFIGEDEIDHTPKDEKVRVYLGEAFDITCERTRANVETIGPNHQKISYEIKLKNHKNNDIVVTVIEDTPGWYEWKIEKSNLEYKKVSAYKVEFQVPVKSNGDNTMTYTIESWWR